MASHSDRLPKLNPLSLLPDTMAAVAMYNQEGGNISDGAQFGYDPLNGGDVIKHGTWNSGIAEQRNSGIDQFNLPSMRDTHAIARTRLYVSNRKRTSHKLQ